MLVLSLFSLPRVSNEISQAKALIRANRRGDFIPENMFQRWYLPTTLPEVCPRLQTKSNVAYG